MWAPVGTDVKDVFGRCGVRAGVSSRFWAADLRDVRLPAKQLPAAGRLQLVVLWD